MVPVLPNALRAAIVTLLLCTATQGQTTPRHRTKPAPTPGQAATVTEIQRLLSAQQAALQSNDPEAIENATRPLAALLLRQMSQLQLVEGHGEVAVDLARKSLALQPSSETQLELASLLLRTGHAKDAADAVSPVLISEPGSAVAWAVRGSALRSSGDDRGAAEALTKSLTIKPDVNVAYALASCFLALHEKQKAQRIFDQIIAASGNAAIQHVAAGDAYREARYLTEAVEEFKKAIAIDPRVGHAEFFLGYTYLQMHEWGPNSQSFEHLRAAVRLAPRDYLSNFYLGAIESTDGSDLASSNRHLHVAAETDPRSPEVWLYLGLNAVREKNIADAKTFLRKAIDLTGADEARNNYQIRRVYAVLGRILIAEGNREEGDALLAKYRQSEDRVISNSASVIANAAANADAHSSSGSASGAPVSFPGMSVPTLPAASTTALQAAAAPQTTEVSRQITATQHQLEVLLASSFNDLGTAEARRGRYADALVHFQEAEHWGTPSPALLHNIGAAAFRVEDFAESARALQLFLKASQENESNSAQQDRSRMMLAMSQFSLGQFSEAEKSFAQIPSLTMQDPRAAYSWAYSLAHSGQQQRANQIAGELAKQSFPSDVMSLVCHIYMDTEDYEHSLTCYQNAYQADPSLKMAHYQAGESLIRLDRPGEAVPELRRELALQPENPDVQYSLAFALLLSGHRPEALTLLQTLTVTNPTHAQAQYQFGKALLEDGKVPEAVSHLEKAVQSDPKPDYIHYQLQAAYRKAGRTEDADRELKIYRDIKARSREGSAAKPTPEQPLSN